MLFLLAGLLVGFTLGFQDLFVLLGAGKKNKFNTLFLIILMIGTIFGVLLPMLMDQLCL